MTSNNNVLSSENGVLRASLTFELATHNLVVVQEEEEEEDRESVGSSTSSTTTTTTLALRTRLFNGVFPGPTFRVQPGDTIELNFTNRLADQSIPFHENKFSAPDETNLHFHGLHISGELPSDDITKVIKPGETFLYTVTLPDDHMPGTHWLHPHRHGSNSLQVGGGAASAIIVEDPKDSTLPLPVKQAQDVLFLAQQMDLEQLESVAQQTNDKSLSVSLLSSSSTTTTSKTVPVRGGKQKSPSPFVTVNGQWKPEIVAIKPWKWIRLRVIWAAWLKGELNLGVPECETYLLAKDGVYIRDFPRKITHRAPIVPGGRADLLVRCTKASSIYNVTNGSDIIATIRTTEHESHATFNGSGDDDELKPWTPDYPAYLTDLRDKEVSPGCSCSTVFNQKGVNGNNFQPGIRLHETYLGSVAEREVVLARHPYHQHVYPFQLIGGFSNDTSSVMNEDDYYAIGDWHDTIQGEGIIRFHPTIYSGKMMVHCHRLNHEDKGMIAIEHVHGNDDERQSCVCRNSMIVERVSFGSFVRKTRFDVVMVGLVLVALGFWSYRRFAHKSNRRSMEVDMAASETTRLQNAERSVQ